MQVNWLILVAAALVPVFLGYPWYHPKVFGTAWQSAVGISEEKMRQGNLVLMMGLMFVFSFIVAFMLQPIVIHQWGLFGVLENQPGMHDNPPSHPDWVAMMEKYGTNFRTFKHGALHGTLTGLLFVLPIVRITSLYEGRSWKYVFITAGFWTVSLALMGGLICQFG